MWKIRRLYISEGIPMPMHLDNYIVHPGTFPDEERLSVCPASRTMSTDIWMASV